ncbi:MAG: sodium:solute symporter family protein [Deltaproteobacteria bacterium]|nr:sodium:solute symporter family protein [Deltaproteobacteria bacterium]
MVATLGNALIWIVYIGVFIFLARKGRGHDAALSGRVGFSVQAFAYVATYISAVALVGFGGLAHAYGMQMLLVAAGNVWLGTWVVYRFLAWPTRVWQQHLGVRSPATLIGTGHNSPALAKALALLFALFLSVYASAVIKGAALLLGQIVPLPLWSLIWGIAVVVGFCVCVGGLRGVLYTEAMQGAIMLAGILMIVGAVLVKTGGPLQGLSDLALLPPTRLATNGFVSLSGGGAGLFILSLVVVTSVAVWAQPQMIQRHFALASRTQARRVAPLAMLILTVLVGGTYFAAALSRLILPDVANPDAVMPLLVRQILPGAGLHLFVLAIVSASLSTTTALFHIASLAIAEDVPARKSTPRTWRLGVALCVLISALCAQADGSLIAILCTTSWSVVGSAALVPYIALVVFGKRHAPAAWSSVVGGLSTCLFWYLCVYGPTAAVTPLPMLAESAFGQIPPFFVGVLFAVAGWGAGIAVSWVPLPRRLPQ